MLGFDLLHTPDGRWVVLEDNLRVPSGLGYAVSNRRTAAAALPMLHPWPGAAVARIRRARPARGAAAVGAAAAASARRRSRCSRTGRATPRGTSTGCWPTSMDVPIVTPDDLRRRPSGVWARRRWPTQSRLDVLYRRLGDDELDRRADGVRAGERAAAGRRLARASVSIVNAPGNGVGDDKAMYAFVPTMIRYYLGEEPIIGDVGTWVLADPNQYEGVRDRLHELVVKPVDGSGGAGVMIGPDLDDAEIATMRAEVEAAPHLFIAQEVIRFSSHPDGDHGRAWHLGMSTCGSSRSPARTERSWYRTSR